MSDNFVLKIFDYNLEGDASDVAVATIELPYTYFDVDDDETGEIIGYSFSVTSWDSVLEQLDSFFQSYKDNTNLLLCIEKDGTLYTDDSVKNLAEAVNRIGLFEESMYEVETHW